MATLENAETEETLTCLCMTFYHPNQEEKQVFRDLNFSQCQRVRADDVIKFGRDSNVCHFNLKDGRVSRIQFALQFFRLFNSSEFGFEIKNLSKRVNLTVNNVELSYLNKVDLPENGIVSFGDYEILMEKRGGQSEDYFEIRFELASASLLLDRDLSFHQPIPESDISSPTEMDENEWEKSHKGQAG
ncbi:PREDICTED: TRAF-interacting protein with FHA domain-containing protein A [Gekko japonicus]|uniref:TRAF-interacting protein with FHA domain-containing protein A n=1 Tax=Gekko japonicus TaxID=146911 RepID=A0ABM1K0Y4_GEKJA|nr:PREDICTED: TRAF-interacting protein with FHA domain-containing protein A [Gekko japonicus]XP_015267372.1 PREDICTED: TRAF-interacting protein with FHA domain-containing protein A [Gekko japonicus]